ncbi:LysR family transcriptional regulator, partial [Klebsiella pneumoniae]|nr:LysR family transcriptional regulator [Klebsiella pneumoniae]
MNLHRIEAFLAVAQSGNISRAATQLEVAQSVLSRHIAGLEAELGVRLFERTGRGVSMTEAAQHLAPRLRAA